MIYGDISSLYVIKYIYLPMSDIDSQSVSSIDNYLIKNYDDEFFDHDHKIDLRISRELREESDVESPVDYDIRIKRSKYGRGFTITKPESNTHTSSL